MANPASADPQEAWDLQDTVEFRQHLHVLHAELKRCEQEETEAKEAYSKKRKAREDARAKLDLAIEEDCRGLPLWEHAKDKGAHSGAAHSSGKRKESNQVKEQPAKIYPMPDHLKPEDLDRAYFVSQLFAAKDVKKPISVKPFSTEGSEWVVHGIANYVNDERHWQALKLVSPQEFKERWPEIEMLLRNPGRSGPLAGDAYAGLLVTNRGKKLVIAPASEGIRFVLKAQEK